MTRQLEKSSIPYSERAVNYMCLHVRTEPLRVSKQECLQLISRQLHEQHQLLRSIRMNLIVIAIPFWLALCSVAVGVALFVMTMMAS